MSADLVAELAAVRAVLEDSEAERVNFAPLLRDAHEANASMAREFAQMHEDRERIRGERDDLAVELAAAREEIAELKVRLDEANPVTSSAHCSCGSVIEIRGEVTGENYQALDDFRDAHADCEVAS